MRRDCHANGFRKFLDFERIVSEIPEAVPELVAAGGERFRGNGQVAACVVRESVRKFVHRSKLERNGREVLRDCVVQLDGETRPLKELELRSYRLKLFPAELATALFDENAERTVPDEESDQGGEKGPDDGEQLPGCPTRTAD